MQEALDAWSLGVMAFELLTGKPALRMTEGKEQVHFQRSLTPLVYKPGQIVRAVHWKIDPNSQIVLSLGT